MAGARFRFELLDRELNGLGELHPVEDVTIVCTPGKAIGRTIPSFELPPDEAADLDIDHHLIRPWVIQGRSSQSLGIYIPSSADSVDDDRGQTREFQLHDQGARLAGLSTTRQAFGIQSGAEFRERLSALAEEFGIVGADDGIISSDLKAGNHLGWAPGTRPYDIFADCAKKLGVTPPWFDLDGTFRMTFLPYAGLTAPSLTLQRGTASTISAAGVQTTTDRWMIPTEWCVFSRAEGADFFGEFSLPSTHPLSAVTRGIPPVHKRVEIPGLTSDEQCRDRARDEAQREARIHNTQVITAATDYSLELYATATAGANDWLIARWDTPLTTGAMSTYELRESLTDEEAA